MKIGSKYVEVAVFCFFLHCFVLIGFSQSAPENGANRSQYERRTDAEIGCRHVCIELCMLVHGCNAHTDVNGVVGGLGLTHGRAWQVTLDKVVCGLVVQVGVTLRYTSFFMRGHGRGGGVHD